MTVFDKLLEPVMPILERIEQACPKHGNETLTWLIWVRALVYFFTKRCGSRNAWSAALGGADPALGLPALPKMTLSDAMHRFSPTLLRQALADLLRSRPFPQHPELALLGLIYAVDGSEFPIRNGMTLPRTSEVMQRVKLHLKFRLNQLLPVDFLISTQEPSERNALRHLFERGATYVLDRGYMAYALLRDAIATDAFVSMRAYHSIVVETVEELSVQVPATLQHQWSGLRDRLVRSAHADAAGLVFRLVEFKVGSTTYKLITNRTDLTTFQVMLLYAYRWQVELAFRFFKHTLNGQQVISIYPWGIENYFAGMFLTAVLHLFFKHDCLIYEGNPPPTDQDLVQEVMVSMVSAGPDSSRPTAQVTVARFMDAINRSLRVFWKVPKAWLVTLAELIHREFTYDIACILNKQAVHISSRL
jgi:hypothetical protein